MSATSQQGITSVEGSVGDSLPHIFTYSDRMQVSALPQAHPASNYFSLFVGYRDTVNGISMYAVMGNHSKVMDAQGNFEWESMPSSRTDDFKERTRFPLERALALAREHVLNLTVNGISYDRADEFVW